MSKKRFTDILIWDKEWFMELSPTHKCLVRYLFDRCDASGVWTPNWKLASMHIKAEVAFEDLKFIPADQYEILSSGKVFLPEFISFQYGSLSHSSPAHKPIFQAIEKNKISDKIFNRVLNRVFNTLQEKEKEKEMDKETEKVLGKSENPLPATPPEPEEIKTDSESLLHQMNDQFKIENPKYYFDRKTDFPALLEIARKIKKLDLIDGEFNEKWTMEAVKKRWGELIPHIAADSHLAKYSISMINKHFQSVIQSYFNVGTNRKIPGEKSSRGEALRAASNKLN